MNSLRTGGILLLIGGACFGQDKWRGCDGTTYDMSVCLSKIYEKSDAELTVAYQAALKELGKWAGNFTAKRQIKNLRTAERNWIAYRDAQCKAQYDLFEGGSGGPLENLACRIEATDQRIAEIRRVYLTPR